MTMFSSQSGCRQFCSAEVDIKKNMTGTENINREQRLNINYVSNIITGFVHFFYLKIPWLFQDYTVSNQGQWNPVALFCTCIEHRAPPILFAHGANFHEFSMSCLHFPGLPGLDFTRLEIIHGFPEFPWPLQTLS